MYCNLQGLLENAKLRRIHSQQIGSCQKHMSVYVESECDQNSDFESCSKKHRCFEGGSIAKQRNRAKRENEKFRILKVFKRFRKVLGRAYGDFAI